MMYISRRPRLLRRLAIAVGVVSVFTIQVLPAVANASNMSFSVLDNNARPGMLMSLRLNNGVVEPATDKNASLLLGVYVENTGNDLTQEPGQVRVATDGQVSTLVSTLNGPVLVGDKIAPSALVGIGARSKGLGYVVGAAQGSLDATTKGAVFTAVTDSVGKPHKVWIARIPVIVKVTSAASAKNSTPPSTAVPKPVQAVADTVAGKHVGFIALLFSFVLFLTGISFAALVIITAIRSGFTAISRQPLAKRFINKELIQSFVVATAVLIVGFASAYLILKLL